MTADKGPTSGYRLLRHVRSGNPRLPTGGPERSDRGSACPGERLDQTTTGWRGAKTDVYALPDVAHLRSRRAPVRGRMSKKQRVTVRWRKKWFEAYQLAGGLLLPPNDFYTEGQRERLRELLLNVLSEPDRFTAKTIHILRDSAVKP